MNDLLKNQRYFFDKEKISIKERIINLKKLKNAIKKYEKEILISLNKDLGKHEFEAYSSEVGFIYSSIDHMVKNLNKWAKPRRIKNDLAQFGGKSYIYKEPYGVCLIIGPFNYPFQLVMEPLIGAISGGNCAVIKPSEFTKETEQIIKRIINETFDKNYIEVVTGDYKVNSELLDLEFDYIFFTGSVKVGKIVMEKASKNLIPLTLELGGKSPVIVDETANLEITAKRICCGKFANSGQTCVAPDYLLVSDKVYEKFLAILRDTIIDFYGPQVKHNNEFGKIVNDNHTNRLLKILEKDSQKIYYGGEETLQNFIEPTILRDITYKDSVMEDEIFGPILPVIKYNNIDDIKFYLNKYKNPLALYVFSNDKKFSEYILTNFSFGGGCLNDTLVHVASKHLPFGGVGSSGIGRYHGKYSFKTFTYEKAVVKKNFRINIELIFPPYKDKIKMIRKVMK
ncbi:MAG: aldehyde dehydrogenase [Peptostreptococcaceae bacterium]